MSPKVKRLYEQARLRVVSLHAVEMSELREKMDKLTDEVEAKDLDLQTMSGLVEETATLQVEVGKLLEVAKKVKANIAIVIGLHKDGLAVKKSVAKILLVAEKAFDL